MRAEHRQDAREIDHATLLLELSGLSERNCTHEHGGGGSELDCDELRKLPDNVCRNLIAYLVRIAAKLHVPYDECEDMAQEALLHAFEHSEQFHGHTLEELRSWLVAIVRNLVMDAFRYRGRHPIQSLNAAAVDPVDEKEANRADMAEWSECLVPWLARLKREDPESYRLICARYLEERTIPELMDETGLKARAISDHTYRALERVRSWASRFGFDGEEVI